MMRLSTVSASGPAEDWTTSSCCSSFFVSSPVNLMKNVSPLFVTSTLLALLPTNGRSALLRDAAVRLASVTMSAVIGPLEPSCRRNLPVLGWPVKGAFALTVKAWISSCEPEPS